MIKKYVFGLCCLLGHAVYAQQSTFTLDGQLGGTAKDKKIVLAYRDGHFKVSDTVGVHDGNFHFEGTITAPTAASLTLLGQDDTSDDVLKVYLDAGVSRVRVTDSLKNAVISGSDLQMDYQRYVNFLKPAEDELDAVDRKWRGLNEVDKEKFWFERDNRTRAAQAEKKRLLLDFADQYPSSYFSLRSLMILCMQDVDAPLIKPVFDRLDSQLRTTADGTKLHERIELANRTVVGAIAPDFVQNDMSDKPVRLSDFRGRYVLLDFWASWCGPCRAENPNLVKAYGRFKDRNFTILGVSLDYPGKKDLWMKAVQADGLPWIQVSDLKGWSNQAAKLYSISAVPQNFLIDPQGKIVAKNLKGEELHEYLDAVLDR